jgi:hypothetical protein
MYKKEREKRKRKCKVYRAYWLKTKSHEPTDYNAWTKAQDRPIPASGTEEKERNIHCSNFYAYCVVLRLHFDRIRQQNPSILCRHPSFPVRSSITIR